MIKSINKNITEPATREFAYAVRAGRYSFGARAASAAEARREVKQWTSLKVAGAYVVNPTPRVGCSFGAPCGRIGSKLQLGHPFSAKRVRLDAGGYDPGGAYWGIRERGKHLYAVQDGRGGLTFVDASTRAEALLKSTPEEL